MVEPTDPSSEATRLQSAMELRRKVLGDAYVDGQAAPGDPVMQELQDYITQTAWGVWDRGGALSLRDRSLLVLAMTAAQGHIEEFVLHAGAQARTGVTDAELDELLFHIAAYCGVPAGVAAKRALLALRADRDREVRRT